MICVILRYDGIMLDFFRSAFFLSFLLIDILHTNAPTVNPAAIEGIEPVFMKPMVPPVAVRAPRTRAVWSRD